MRHSLDQDSFTIIALIVELKEYFRIFLHRKNLVIVCCVSRKSSSFAKRLRQGWEWERERERERGGGGSGVTRDELENELAGRSTLNQRHRCADLPSSWRLTSTRTHSLPRTLVFRGFTSHQLASGDARETTGRRVLVCSCCFFDTFTPAPRHLAEEWGLEVKQVWLRSWNRRGWRSS